MNFLTAAAGASLLSSYPENASHLSTGLFIASWVLAPIAGIILWRWDIWARRN